jgi:hypothetical protein
MTTSNTPHTPTPWSACTSELVPDEILVLADETCVASVPIWNDEDDDDFADESRANADFIIRACNAHDDFVGLLRLALRAFNTKRCFRVADTNSYKIAAAIESVFQAASISPYLTDPP